MMEPISETGNSGEGAALRKKINSIWDIINLKRLVYLQTRPLSLQNSVGEDYLRETPLGIYPHCKGSAVVKAMGLDEAFQGGAKDETKGKQCLEGVMG